MWFGLFKHNLATFGSMTPASQSAVIGRDITKEGVQTVHSGSYQAPSNVFDSRMVTARIMRRAAAACMSCDCLHVHRATRACTQATTGATWIAHGASCTARLTRGAQPCNSALTVMLWQKARGSRSFATAAT